MNRLATGYLWHLDFQLPPRRNGWKSEYFVLISDGECDEGSNWEAIVLAGHLGLDNLTVIVDYNKIQSFGTVKEVLDLEPFADKWRACKSGGSAKLGHSFDELVAGAFVSSYSPVNCVVIALTIKR